MFLSYIFHRYFHFSCLLQFCYINSEWSRWHPVHTNTIRCGSCMVNIVAATDHRVKYINRSVIIFDDHRRRLRRAAETWNKYPFPYSNVGRVQRGRGRWGRDHRTRLIYKSLLLFEWDLLIREVWNPQSAPTTIILFDWNDRFWTNLTLQWRPLTAMI